MHCNHRCYECHIPACPDRVRQSIGPRIVPMFADPPEWSADKVYSPLTLVIHNGATYMSRRCVPANTALPDTDPFYNESWVMVYDMNAQVAQYREEVAKLSQQVTAFGGKIDNWEQLIVQWTALIQGWQNQFPELTKALAAITERVAAIEPKLDQALEDITALQTTQQTHTEQIAANTQGLADLTPRVAAAETHLSALDEEQKVQDEHLNNLDASQTEQDTRIQAAHDLAVQAKTIADNNTQQITENAGKIAANAAEIAKHAEQLEALKAADTALDGKISQNTAAIAQNTADIAQAKTDIKQAAAAAQQAQDTANHADAAASKAQTTAEAAQEAAEAAQSAADQAKADNTTQDGRLDSLEAAQQQTAQDVANLKDGSTELPYVKKVNGNATGTLAVENISVSGTATVKAPVNGTDAANKTYVDQAVQNATGGIEGDLAGYLPLKGGIMAGNVSFRNIHTVVNLAAPTNNGDAANKKYVDDAVQNATGGITPDVTQLKSDVEALQQSQGTQDGKISALETAQTEQDSRLDKLENGTTALPYLKKTGDIGTGTFNFTSAQLQIAEPTADNHPTSKKYVDQAVENATDPELEGRVEALETSQATQDTKLTNIENGTTALPYLKNSGDTSSGTYNFTGSVSVPVPSTSGQAANKQYVDSTINSKIDALEGQIGLTGPTGHVVFVDAAKLAIDTTLNISREADTDYCFQMYKTVANTPDLDGAVILSNWYDSVESARGYQVTANNSEINITNNSGNPAIIVVYKFVADGDQPQPGPTTFFTELNPPVILSATTSHPQSVEGDLSATLNAMIAAQSNWFKYKMQDGSGKTYYVMSASEIQPTDSSAANVLYCTEAGTWYQGETLNLAYGKYGDILISAYYPNFEIVSPGRPNFSVGTFDTAREAVTRLGTDKTFIMAANNAIIRLDNGSDFKNILDNYMQIGTVYTNPDEYHDLRATLFTNGSDSAKPENLDIPSIGPWSDASGWQYKKTY